MLQRFSSFLSIFGYLVLRMGPKLTQFLIRAPTGGKGSLSSNVFEQRTSTGSELFSPLIRLDATNYVLLSVFTLIETICPNVFSKSQLKCAKSPLPVDVRRSKTSLLKLPSSINFWSPAGK